MKNRTNGASQKVKISILFIVAALIFALAPHLNSPASATEVASSINVGEHLYGYDGEDGYTLTLVKSTTTGESFHFGVSLEHADFSIAEFTSSSTPSIPWMGNDDFMKFTNIPVGTDYYIYEEDNNGCITTISYSGITSSASINYSDPSPGIGGTMTGDVTITFTNERLGTPKYPYEIRYYKDNSDSETNRVGTENGITEFPNDTPFSEADVDSDFPAGWKNLHKPTGYEDGDVEYIVDNITDEAGHNIVIVVYRPTPKYPYEIRYYKDNSDSETNRVGTENGITEFPNDTPFSEADVDSDFPAGWKNLHKPTGYEDGTAEYVVEFITTVEDENIVIVVYKPNQPVHDPTKYPYRVEYYQDSITPENKLGGDVPGTTIFDAGHKLTEPEVASDLGANWINLRRPIGYGNGSTKDFSLTIKTTVDDNVIRVLYVRNVMNNDDGGDGEPGTTPTGTTPTTDNPPSGPDDPPDEERTTDDEQQGERQTESGHLMMAQEDDPPTEGGNNHDVPPVAHISNSIISYVDDEHYLELDEDGVPLGEWHWDNDLQEWIYDEYPPLGSLPRTGADNLPGLLIMLACLSVAGPVLIIKRRPAYNAKHDK